MTKRKFVILTEDELDEKFNLLTNPFIDDAGWNGCFFETYGQELDYVRDCNPAYIWTYLNGDEGDIIVSGYHLVNRINYLISVEPIPDDTDYQIDIEDID